MKTKKEKDVKSWFHLTAEKTFVGLLILVIILSLLNIAQVNGLFIPKQPQVMIEGNTISLHSLTLDQKIAQMLIVQGNINNLDPLKNLQVGGLHFFARESEEIFKQQIDLFQAGMRIPFFVTVDLEGCVSPFIYFRNFTPAAEINTIEEAYDKGVEEGQFLQGIGVNLNFAPVVDLDDQIWKCRSFPGDERHISDLAQAYIKGLQKNNILATAKHYPGKTLVVRDPHKFIVNARIDPRDIFPYDYLAEIGEVKAVMVSHIITDGAINSGTVPSVVSRKVLDDLKKKYPGLIISDEIHMLGLKNFYNSLDEMYVAVFKAGNDLVLNFDSDANEIYHMIQVVKEAVQSGEIWIEDIDRSVTKVLEAKGFKVV